MAIHYLTQEHLVKRYGTVHKVWIWVAKSQKRVRNQVWFLNTHRTHKTILLYPQGTCHLIHNRYTFKIGKKIGKKE